MLRTPRGMAKGKKRCSTTWRNTRQLWGLNLVPLTWGTPCPSCRAAGLSLTVESTDGSHLKTVAGWWRMRDVTRSRPTPQPGDGGECVGFPAKSEHQAKNWWYSVRALFSFYYYFLRMNDTPSSSISQTSDCDMQQFIYYLGVIISMMPPGGVGVV